VGAQAPSYTNLEAYLDFRRLNCGGYWVLSTTQYALDIHLTDEELAEPKLMTCEKLCLGELICLAKVLNRDINEFVRCIWDGKWWAIIILNVTW
jgi:hypothetical protein